MFSITEDDINQWASHQHNAENVLPDLVRRIIYALVPEAKPVFGAYKATKLEGYDGELMTPDRSLFAGTTASVWELSIRSDRGFGSKLAISYAKVLKAQKLLIKTFIRSSEPLSF